MTARILALQHHPTSPAGVFGEQLAARGARLQVLDAEHGCILPVEPFDGLVLLGGVMNAYDDVRCPHFVPLLATIRRCAAEGRPVLGICLGAQLIARAFGAVVEIGGAPEFGYVDLETLPAAAGDPLVADAGAGLPVMQWHDDGFALPEAAALLMRGERGRNQAFRLGDGVYGFQCHLEVDTATVRRWGALRAKEKGNPAIAMRLGAEIARHQARAERFGRSVADAWLGLVEDASRRRGAAS